MLPHHVELGEVGIHLSLRVVLKQGAIRVTEKDQDLRCPGADTQENDEYKYKKHAQESLGGSVGGGRGGRRSMS